MATARILNGKEIADQVRAEIAEDAAAFTKSTGVRPHLTVVLVGEDPASQVYVRGKRKACDKCGFESTQHTLPATTSQQELMSLIDQLNRDDGVHGILVQLPLPGDLDERQVLLAVHPNKDVDAFHPYNVGLIAQGHPRFLPCTPAGVVEILKRSDIPINGKDVVIVGRSSLVGRPLSMMLSQKGQNADATVTLCHSRTADLAGHLKRADILIAAIGRPGFVTGDMIKPGAAVIDVGINRTDDGKLVGDVDYEAALDIASAVTPVPGGVGPMTITMLLANTLKAARLMEEEGTRD